uniref:preprotein translocase subunit G n=1 Tax=Goniotrichopsis reniformis TaxID=468933 RepID=UPI001FCD38C1|nr:preprotein translocase subunit G [Goniotrichopsis reniformis]UNJ14830.1 preprotein translocase subunit G [Goniotrichopsis reniformis]
MIQLIRFLWYLNMLLVIFFILKQEPKLKGMNNLSQREQGFSLSSTKERILRQQTWGLLISFVTLTVLIVKFNA